MASDATHGLPDISAIVEREQPDQIVWLVERDMWPAENKDETVYIASSEEKARQWIQLKAPEIASCYSVTAWALDA